MSSPSRDPRIEHEPQFADRPAAPDPAEGKADRILGKSEFSERDSAAHSVFDELDILPHRQPEVIDRDWHCSQCGYNLRGLKTGQRCPECGRIELYRPPPTDSASLANRNRAKAAQVSSAASAFVVIAAALCGGPWAVLGTFLSYMPHPLMSIVIGPATEEVMKLAMIIMVIELRPYLIRSADQIRIAAAVSALGFALIENLLYLHVYVTQPSFALAAWRWVACSSLHLGCTWYASRGLVESWQNAMEKGHADRAPGAYRRLLGAIIIHGAFNALVTVLDRLGLGF